VRTLQPKLGVEVGHDMLNSGVILEPILGEVFAVARVLEATVWHLGHDWNVGIDPNATKIECPSKPHGSTVIFGPDTGS